MIIRIDYSSQAQVRLDLWGGSSGTFEGIDRFGRVVDQRWVNYSGTPTDVDRYQYGYDRDSNRTWKANGTTTLKDEFYTYDPLNRLSEMQRGTLNSGKTGISGTPVREMDWTLDPTGNWPAYLTKTAGTTDLNQTRTHNLVNEITTFAGTPSWSTPPSYDAAGNMKSFPQPATPTSDYSAVYDAWNRPVSVSDTTPNTVAEYQYDGSNWRTVKKTYTSGVLSETRHFYYTSSWQDVEERVGASTSADQQYVWGIRYVDELICRDDPTNGRLYAMQDANFNLTGITDTSGVPQERYLFDPYGTRAIYDGSWGSIGASAYDWTVGHQGLAIDQETGLIYNRNRMLHPTMGRFVQRDPLRYAGSYNCYEYALSRPNNVRDRFGLLPQDDGQSWLKLILDTIGWDMHGTKGCGDCEDCDCVLERAAGLAMDLYLRQLVYAFYNTLNPADPALPGHLQQIVDKSRALGTCAAMWVANCDDRKPPCDPIPVPVPVPDQVRIPDSTVRDIVDNSKNALIGGSVVGGVILGAILILAL